MPLQNDGNVPINKWVGMPVRNKNGDRIGTITCYKDKTVTALVNDQTLIDKISNGIQPQLSMGCYVERARWRSEDTIDLSPMVEYPPADEVGRLFSNVSFSVVDEKNLLDPRCVITHTEETE